MGKAGPTRGRPCAMSVPGCVVATRIQAAVSVQHLLPISLEPSSRLTFRGFG